jgi:tetratricopeptide (TPR) repeat protein
MNKDSMTNWKITGIIATLVIILSIPLYVAMEKKRPEPVANRGRDGGLVFVGSGKCKDCHKQEFDKWKGSHHERAMDVAAEETVLGDFNNAVFEHFGVTSRFYKKNGGFYVRTPGPEGKMGDFKITHTFGYFPLQQYLIPFSGGRLQCLPIAWDIRRKKWYHLYPDKNIDPGDWLYWTNQAQNWNGMCAECHSTDLKKNYDLQTSNYKTSWSEISVGCEACHGPGSAHIKWAELPEMARPDLVNAGLEVHTDRLGPQEQIAICSPCHSRRMSLGDNIHHHADYMDYGVPQLLSEGFYFADGQILEEVYVYGSFMQSKMAARGVRCSDCHDVHNIKRIKSGNDLCLQCHKEAVYDTKDHHFHKHTGESGDPIKSSSGEVLFDVGTGAQCEHCHMPGRHYMGVDYRLDHSFRIPRPSLSIALGVPNACNRCHADKSLQWSADFIKKWYGEKKQAHYGAIIAQGRQREPGAVEGLSKLTADRLYPAIVRATALSLLSSYHGPEPETAFLRALTDEEALVRHTAVRNLTEQDPEKLLQVLGPLLYDPVKAVRIEAAARLAGPASRLMSARLKTKFDAALSEYLKATERIADFAASRHNLGNLYASLGNRDQAVLHYTKAIEIDDRFYPAKINLASIYNAQGANDKAEKLLREVLAIEPDFYETKYSLGLLLAETKKFSEAEAFLSQAAHGMPKRDRIYYNLGLVRQQLHRDEAAEEALKTAHGLAPENGDYLYALAVFYLQRHRLADAEQMALKMVALKAHSDMGKEFLGVIAKLKAASRMAH